MECDHSLSLMEQVLASDEIGRDEQSTLALLRKLDVCYMCVIYINHFYRDICYMHSFLAIIVVVTYVGFG